jgi:protein required for attachment to host cells
MRFAKEIVDHLETARNEQSLRAASCVVAEPRFLGHLRSAFGRVFRESVVNEIDKDLIELDAAQRSVSDCARQPADIGH